MVILIASERDLPNELDTLHQLFEAGLEFYHFRKPSYDVDKCGAYLSQIDPRFLNRIMIHDHHELTQTYPVKGIHLEERKWREKGSKLTSYVANFKSQGFQVSSSYHEVEDLMTQEVSFDYYMLSPVFGAISKPGYKGRGFEVSHINKTIVGMGGINAKTTPEALFLGFHGVGTLGGIWNAVNPVEAFNEIQTAFQNKTNL